MYVQITSYFEGDVKEPKNVDPMLLNKKMLKVSNKYTKTRCETISSLTIKTTSLA